MRFSNFFSQDSLMFLGGRDGCEPPDPLRPRHRNSPHCTAHVSQTMQNGHVESFNGRLRDECLNANWFRNLMDARAKITAWRDEYNGERPHSSLGYRTPNEFAETLKSSVMTG